jgi:hypothetical protein
MPNAFLLLFVANVVFATSYGVTRVVLDDVPPAMLGLARSVIGSAPRGSPRAITGASP